MVYSEAHANHAINFIQELKLTKGKWAGQPFILLPWEKELVSKLFGTLREDGTRQYRTAYVEIGKKTGNRSWGQPLLYICSWQMGNLMQKCMWQPVIGNKLVLFLTPV